ncbi:LLM class flavin-dependent oxidoreductase [Bacillus salipaludis]|uniref:LLM class flavin-dependent oxidoreductase n=1 Tax=Bacillus salipaludis TaxID=2547811 RepID=A0ABW8REV4_9BACI
MKFGLYSEMQLPPGKTEKQVYDEVIEQIIHADKAGFDVYSLIDHHHFSNFSISANPLAMYAAVASRTNTIRFRTALHILPVQNPLRLAGEIAAADLITNGRIEVGVGRGHAWVYPNQGIIPIEEAKPRFEEAISILEQALQGEKVSYFGKYYTADNVDVVPHPLQKNIPFTTGGTSEHTYRQAGEKGWGIFVPPLLPLTLLLDKFDVYRKACWDNGHEPQIIWLRSIYMSDGDEKQIRQEAEVHFRNFLLGNAAPTVGLPDVERMKNAGFHFYTKGILQSLPKMSYEELLEKNVVWAGNPEMICEKIDKIKQEVEGLVEIDFLTNYGGMDHWKVLKQQELLSKRVMPNFKKIKEPELNRI